MLLVPLPSLNVSICLLASLRVAFTKRSPLLMSDAQVRVHSRSPAMIGWVTDQVRVFFFLCLDSQSPIRSKNLSTIGASPRRAPVYSNGTAQ